MRCFAEVVGADKERATSLIQKLYLEPIREELIARRVEEIKRAASLRQLHRKASASAPAQDAVDVFVVQSTVSTVRHISMVTRRSIWGVLQSEKVPYRKCNTVTFNATRAHADRCRALLIGVGPGAAYRGHWAWCSTGRQRPRKAARDDHFKKLAAMFLSSPTAYRGEATLQGACVRV